MESASLVTSIEFDEVKRGYDPEQVDNYLEQVAKRVVLLQENLRAAVDRAEAAEARVAEALRQKSALEKQLEEAKAAAGQDDGTEALKKMLMLAQRTADSAVEEAQASAKNIVADARTKAAEIVADAEKRSERLLIEAQKVADEMMQQRSADIVREVAELQRQRELLEADIEVLTKYLDEHRQKLREGLKLLTQLVDQPGLFRAEALPVTKARAEQASAEPEVHNGQTDSREAEQAGSDGTETVASSGSDATETVASSAPVVATTPEPTPASSDGPAAGTTTPASPEAADTPREVEVRPPAATPSPLPPVPPQTQAVEPSGSTLTAQRDDPEAEFPEVKVPEILADVPVLFDAEAEADAGPPTQELSAIDRERLLQVGDETDDPLGPPDEEADEAMRRFFEEEPADPRDKKGLFRRK
ncbi:MAG: DivIVA domain-containing protein [Acidimicrobiales bacterium]|nr:DivIVA domain-containing protein [Acidimicrobiales bacterium]